MYRSQTFQKQLVRIKKKSSGSWGESALQELESAFLKLLPAAPSGLETELFNYLSAEVFDSNRPETLFGDVIDLLWQDYDDREDPLSPGDWDLLKELIDEFAPDLPLEQIQYIMERVVSHGRL